MLGELILLASIVATQVHPADDVASLQAEVLRQAAIIEGLKEDVANMEAAYRQEVANSDVIIGRYEQRVKKLSRSRSYERTLCWIKTGAGAAVGYMIGNDD